MTQLQDELKKVLIRQWWNNKTKVWLHEFTLSKIKKINEKSFNSSFRVFSMYRTMHFLQRVKKYNFTISLKYKKVRMILKIFN